MPIKNKNLYPKNWKELRLNILNRAGNKCEFCGVRNYAYGYRFDDKFFEADCSHEEEQIFIIHKIKPIKIVLTIAHICHDASCDNLEHLKALCQRCHLRLDIDLHKRNSNITRRNKKAVCDLFLP